MIELKNKILTLILVLFGVVLTSISVNYLIYPQIKKSETDKSNNKAITQFENDVNRINKKSNSISNNTPLSLKRRTAKKQNNANKHNSSTTNITQSNNKSKRNLTLEDLKKDIKQYNENIYNEGQGALNEESYSIPAFDISKYGIKNNVYGYISIQKIKVKMPIYLGCNDSTMAKGAAHLSQTSIPYGGKNTNSVIAGHCGYGYSDYFKYLEKLKAGDIIRITTPFNKLVYIVKQRKIIKPQITNDLLISTGKDQLTLFTCYPFPENKQRCLIICEREKKGKTI